jgi:hypothetical protein
LTVGGASEQIQEAAGSVAVCADTDLVIVRETVKIAMI